MNLNIIVAHDKNNVIGNSKTNDIPWKLTPDLVRFKKITSGHPIIMGRKTFDSLPKILPNRKHIVITSDFSKPNIDEFEDLEKDVYYFSSLIKGIVFCESWLKVEQSFIIGGSTIYNDAIKNHKIDKIYKTILLDEYEGDITFPLLDNSWKRNFISEQLDYLGTKFYFETLIKNK